MVLQFVHSISESNFTLLVNQLGALFFFGVVSSNYACWVSVHARDMCELLNTLPDVFDRFNLVKFTVQKAVHASSGMIDYVHE
jgi:hypothetical protein